jgi:cation-transporting P-type ATPase F
MFQAPADPHARSGTELCGLLGSDPEAGLSEAAAARRLADLGPNAIDTREGRPAWQRLLLQFIDPLLLTLLLVGVVKLLLGDPHEALVIWSVSVINSVIGFIQESRAETAIAALARSVSTDVEVVRDGQRRRLPSEQLVPGDLVRLEAGDRVPADLRLLQCRTLRLDEAALTGESLPVSKGTTRVAADAPLAERLGMAHAGTFVTAGQGLGLVVATAGATAIGAISTAMQEQVNLSTPLTRQIRRFSRTLLQAIVVLASLTFVVGVLRGRSSSEMFDGAVALAVGAIPEELPAMVTITLAIGVRRMARRNAIIRKLPAVEALGSTTVICADKTGTLTQNRMTVAEIFAGGELLPLEDLWPENPRSSTFSSAGQAPQRNVALDETLLAGLLCNDARPSSREGLVGDPTETALLAAAEAAGINRDHALSNHPRHDAIPFASEQQYMATLHGSARILLKGSVEAVLQRCSRQLDAAGGSEPLDRPAIERAVAAMASRGQRVLAFAIARAQTNQRRLNHEDVAADLDFLGLQGMLDPPRSEAIRAVAACQRAGITVKMITGDHAETARAIATTMGIGGPAPITVLDGRQLTALGDEGLLAKVADVDVFARVAPEQKLQLVQALQACGAVVAMTGDGVNDAPALKQADIGIAMGAGGTEVAREAADMLLTDDNFATIEAAVEEGRGVYLNLRKALAFVLPVNGGASMTILLGALLGLDLPVTALQVLWLNMVCTLTMSLSLAFEPRPPGLMEQAPRPPRQPLLTGPLVSRVLVVSLFNWVLLFALFLWVRDHGGSLSLARTMAIQGLVLAHLVYLVCISQLGADLRHWRRVPAVVVAVVATVLIQLLFSQAPWMNGFFATAPLDLRQWGLCSLGMGPMLPVALLVERLDPLHLQEVRSGRQAERTSLRVLHP